MHTSEVRTYLGTTRLFIDDRQVPPMAYQFMPSDPELTNNIPCPPEMDSEKQLRAMYSAGVRLYFIRLEVNDPEREDEVFDRLRRSAALLERCAPGAYAMPWLIIGPYEDFHRKYPNEVQVFDDGTTGGYLSDLSGRIADPNAPRHTHASLAWRCEVSGLLRRLAERAMRDELLSHAIAVWFFFTLHH